MKDDTISRAAALNCVYGTSPNKIKGRIAELPSATDTNVGGNLIDRQAALDALADAMPSLTTPDGCGQFDHDIQVTDEAYLDCMRIIHDLPSVQPGWIPVTERLPQNGYWLWSANGGVVKKDFYWDGHWELAEKYGYEVLAWMPLPKPWEGGQNGV